MPHASLSLSALKKASFNSSRSLHTLGVIGAGQMGLGIAQVASANASLKVLLHDTNSVQITKAIESISKNLEKQKEKGKLNEQQKTETLGRIRAAGSLAEFSEADFIIEAVKEDFSIKSAIFNQLSQIASKKAILATNTSSISITKLASSYLNPQNVIGMHFMNPVPVMALVEIINGLQTSKQTLEATLELAKKMGKTTTISKDFPGFIANRLLMPYINEAIFALQEGIASKEDIDLTMKLGTNVPMGPLLLADFIGLDTCLSIMQVLHRELGDSKYRPASLLVNYVNAGLLGKKTLKGFYEYPSK